MTSAIPRRASGTGLRKEEAIGLLVAGLLHVALVAVLLVQPDPPANPPMPERMTVNLSEDVGLTSTAPDPVRESRASVAPTLADTPTPAMAEAPAPLPQPTAEPRPRTRAETPPRARPTAAPQPRRTSSSQSTPEPRRTSQPTPRQTTAPRSGGSRIGADFLPGAGASQTDDTRIPASQIGASAKASIVQAIARQIKPHWSAPSGAEAEELVTLLAFDLNEDGSLNGRPRLVSQSGVTPANSPQKDLHAERAIRAVQLAAPFDLPAEYYNAWKSIRGARFDRNLSR